jgi:peptide/nickel transport system permease protein
MNRLWPALLADRRSIAGLMMLAGFFAIAVLAPILIGDANAPLAMPHSPPSSAHWLGTTGQGQDVLRQALVGARPTLLVGFGVGLAVTVLGALIGAIAGYLGGKIDEGLSLAINVSLLVPGLPLAVVIAAYLPPGPMTLFLVLTATGWAWNARVLRSQTLSLREAEYVQAAIVGGAAWPTILWREVMPNLASVMMSCFIGSTVYAIGAQVGLEFLGLGDVGQVTWGTNLYWASNDAALLTGAWWTFVPSGLLVAGVGFSLVLINSALDEVSNPRLQATSAWRRLLGSAVPAGAATLVRRSNNA